jgi:TP901 family phage tail tape measure protein
MAVGATGQDETIKIGVQTSIVGVKESIDKLKDLSRQLTAIDKQLRSGLDSSSLTKQFADVAKQFEKVTKSVTSGSADSQKSLQKMTDQVNKLNAEMAKVQKSKGIGFVGDKKDLAGMKAYKDRLDTVGHAVMAQPKNFGMAIQNIRRFRNDMHDTSKVGIATAASLRAIDGGPPAFMQALNNSQKLRLSLGVVRENLTAVSLQFRSQAKDMQWVGRQMAEGITLPIVGLGTMAVRSFMSVQSEMIQLKKVTEFGFGKTKEEADAFYGSLVDGAGGIREMSREFGVGRKAATGLFKDVAALGIDGEEGIKKFSKAVSEIGMVGEVDTDTAMQFFRTMNAIFVDGAVDSEGLEKTRDLMAQMSAVADETSLQLKDLAAAFPEVAPVMDQMGFSAGGVAAALAGMYKRGIPATEAAHGLKFALQRLVSPTKDSGELIKKMGFSFFDAGGNVKKADIEVMALAKNLDQMSPEKASKALGELFGLRQTARMQSFFQDVNIGREELEKLERGAISASDMTSDYARGLVASGQFAGAAIKPMDRYNKALEEIKKDPTTGIKRLKAGFDDFKVELGATIAPALIRVGEIVIKILDLFKKLPNSMQILIVGAAVFVAALAPIMIILAQMTHAFVTLGRVALKVLPKLASNFTPAVAMGSIGAGQSTAIQAGSKTTAALGFRDRFRYGLGMRTSAEKAVAAAGGAAKTSSLAPETAATGALTSAKEALTAASVKVAAAEAAETAAHNGNTTAMGAQAVAMNKGAAWRGGAWRDLNKTKGNIISYTRALELMTDQQKAAHFVAPLKPGYTPPVTKPMSKAAMGASMTSQYDDIIKKAKAATAAQKQQQAFTNLVTTSQALSAKQTAASSAAVGFGSLTSGVGAQFKSLWTSASTTFFTPLGNAAGKAKKQLGEMAAAAKLSSAGQGVSALMGGTVGAFSKGRKGELAAGAAAALPLGKVGKTFGGLGQVFGGLTGKLNIVKGPLGTIISLFLKFNKITLILTVVAGAIAFIVTMFKGMKTNWEAVMAKIQPGIDAIKAAFGRLKETFAGVFEKMMGIFGQLGTGAEEGKGAASAFEGIGGIIGTVFNAIAAAIDFVGTVIKFIWPFFERTAYIVKNTVGFVAALFKGQWKQAFMFALATVYEWVRPVLIAFDIVVKGIAQAISTILGLMSKIPFVGNSIKGAAKAVEEFSDTGIVGILDDKLRTGLGGVFGPGTTGPAKTEAKKAGGDIGDTLGEAINDGAGDAADGESWVKKWTETVVSEIDNQLEKLKKSATDALAKAHEAALKVYDDRIKAIEDQEKAEEKLFRTEEYLAKKRDLLAKRNLDNQNYQKNRALAIYEGRYDDARMLDLQERANKKSYSDELSSIENSRSKDLIKEIRDSLKEQINAEKDAAKAKFDIQKQSFEDYLEELYKMTPVTVEQFQSMMDQINGVLEQSGANWPGYAETAMSRMGKALSDANKKIINEFNRTDNNPLLQWVAAFAEPEVVRILKEGLSKATGGGGSGGSGGSGLPSGESAAKPDEPTVPDNIKNTVKDAAERALDETAAAAAAAFGGAEYTPIEVNLGDYGNNVAKFLENTTAEYFQLADGEIITRTEAMTRKVSGGALNIVATTTKSMHTMYTKHGSDYQKMLSNMQAYRKGFDASVLGSAAYTTQKVIRYQDENGENWIEVNGVMRSESGKTATAIKNSSGQITAVMTADAKRVEIANTTTFVGARSLMQEMIDKGLKPGQVETQLYIDKINGMGFAIDWINGKPIVVKIDMNTEAFWRNAALVTAYTKSFEGRSSIAAQYGPQGSQVFEFAGAMYIKYADGRVAILASGGMVDASSQSIKKFADGGLVKNQKNGILANIGEGGFDEFVITTDPKYRASNLGYLSAAASRLGVKMASGAAIKAASGGMFTSTGASGSSAEYASGMGGDVYINVDTFIGEEEWFASMASKYNMKAVPRQRKIEGQQKRVVSSYNDRWSLK